MKFVVDANVLFSFFWKDSFTKRLLTGKYFELYSPEFSLEEIGNYKKEIMRKAKLDSEEFDRLRRELILYVDFLSVEDYRKFLRKGVGISPDKDDVDYFALALKLGIGIWSNDKLLKEQSVVKVFNTMEVVNFSNNVQPPDICRRLK